MRANEFLAERFINLTTPDEKRKYMDVVLPLLHTSYSAVKGGLGDVDTENLINTPGIWKLVRKGGQIIAGKIYRTANGRKTRLTLHNGSREGKDAVKAIMRTDMELGRSWTEASGAVEHLLLKKGGKGVPNHKAPSILGKDPAGFKMDPDGVHYFRDVDGSGKMVRKIIIGTVDASE